MEDGTEREPWTTVPRGRGERRELSRAVVAEGILAWPVDELRQFTHDELDLRRGRPSPRRRNRTMPDASDTWNQASACVERWFSSKQGTNVSFTQRARLGSYGVAYLVAVLDAPDAEAYVEDDLHRDDGLETQVSPRTLVVRAIDQLLDGAARDSLTHREREQLAARVIEMGPYVRRRYGPRAEDVAQAAAESVVRLRTVVRDRDAYLKRVIHTSFIEMIKDESKQKLGEEVDNPELDARPEGQKLGEAAGALGVDPKVPAGSRATGGAVTPGFVAQAGDPDSPVRGVEDRELNASEYFARLVHEYQDEIASELRARLRPSSVVLQAALGGLEVLLAEVTCVDVPEVPVSGLNRGPVCTPYVVRWLMLRDGLPLDDTQARRRLSEGTGTRAGNELLHAITVVFHRHESVVDEAGDGMGGEDGEDAPREETS